MLNCLGFLTRLRINWVSAGHMFSQHCWSSSLIIQWTSPGVSSGWKKESKRRRVEVYKASWCLSKELSHCHFWRILLVITFTIRTQIQGSRILLVLPFSFFFCVELQLKLWNVKSFLLPALVFYCWHKFGALNNTNLLSYYSIGQKFITVFSGLIKV